ncbi:MAG: hypothetical protein DRN15_11095 [Thermoprotei archaeon]|nr:MAG: hypothetical protein DRN15_11095 [Thermoprotei archaeon]
MEQITPGIEEVDEEKREKILAELERQHRRFRALQVLRQATRYVEGYLRDYRLNIEADYRAVNPWIKITVVLSEEE